MKFCRKVPCGSESDILNACPERLLLRAKQTFSVENRTSDFECLLLGDKQTLFVRSCQDRS